jgi:serine/threonine protein kinase
VDHHTFSPPSYDLLREIGRSTGDRAIYYLATAQTSQQKVIISRYLFPENKSDLVASFNHAAILPRLKAIKNEGILAYLDGFSINNSVCFVQEYSDLTHLVISPQTSLQDLYQTIIQILKILASLQSSSSPVFDCHLSPDSIWTDETGKLYLMDFGYAQIGEQLMPLAMAKLGRNSEFFAPENQRNRPLTTKSDLYSLGVTIIYWLLQKDAGKNTTITGSDGSINVAGLIPETVSLEWIEWLEKMAAISPKDRFRDAETALENFQDIYLERSADLQIRPEIISFKANRYGEILSETVTIFNPVPNTNLSGKIYFQDASSRMIERKSNWLTAKPSHFEGNKVDIQLMVDTSKLMA